MAVSNIREQIETRLDQLSDEELAAVLHYIEAMESPELPADYDEASDPSIGFLSADPDFSTRLEAIDDPSVGFLSGQIDFAARHAKQILYDEITALSGWTQKKD